MHPCVASFMSRQRLVLSDLLRQKDFCCAKMYQSLASEPMSTGQTKPLSLQVRTALYILSALEQKSSDRKLFEVFTEKMSLTSIPISQMKRDGQLILLTGAKSVVELCCHRVKAW